MKLDSEPSKMTKVNFLNCNCVNASYLMCRKYLEVTITDSLGMKCMTKVKTLTNPRYCREG